MAQPSPGASPGSSPYPFAFAPDIIRAHQKDSYFQGMLTNQLTDLHRRLLGARSAHAWATESRTLSELAYLCLTTLLGNRTLGEEYCDLIQVEGSSGALPALPRRAAYIAGRVLLPYGLSKVLPRARARIRAVAENKEQRERERERRRLTAPGRDRQDGRPASWRARLRRYLLANLGSVTSPAPVYAVSLALFYFTGSYYELAKRATGLRYIFARRIGERSDRAGYEVLGVLLVVQLAVQAYLHMRSTLAGGSNADEAARPPSSQAGREGEVQAAAAAAVEHVDVSLNEHAYSSNNALLSSVAAAAAAPGSSSSTATALVGLAEAMHTPVPQRPRIDLADWSTMGWIKGPQRRKCTLCLEELKEPSATQCGHVFCWACIYDWVNEKPECPLCRRECLAQHVLPLRAA